jgi:hypothetical protein
MKVKIASFDKYEPSIVCFSDKFYLALLIKLLTYAHISGISYALRRYEVVP